MKRTTPHRLAIAALLLTATLGMAAAAHAVPSTPAPRPNAAIIKTRVFNDCPSSTVTTTNNYPSQITIEDDNVDCFGFANLHVWTLSQDAGATEAVFDNPAHFRLSMDFKIEGTGNGEGGIRVSPWYSHDADGLFNVRSTDGEIACFGGRLPFYSFTGAYGLHYVKGDVIHLGVVYEPHSLSSSDPGQIEYTVTYHGTTYSSGFIPFDQGNASEDPPHGLWGILNDARVGGHFKAFLGQGTSVNVKATFSDIDFSSTPVVDGALTKLRVFNDCPSSTLTAINNYSSLISFDDQNVDCFGFANLDVWTFTENGVEAIFNNNAQYHIGTDFKIDGTGNGEGGLRVSPWFSHDADGLFNVRSTDGEVACFGGRLPFYTFTGAYGLHYAKGNTIHLEAIYTPNARTAVDPATIEYKVSYLGTDYTSGPLPFDSGNLSEDPPHTLYGELNDARVGGHFKAFLGQGTSVGVTGTFTNISFSSCLNPVALTKLELHPHDFDLKKKDKYVELEIVPAPPYTASDIDVTSLSLNGVPALATPAPKLEDNGAKLKVKFSRSAVQATLVPGDHVLVDVEGEIGAGCLSQQLFVKVKGKKMHEPHADAQVAAGSQTDVLWDVDPSVGSVSVLSSFDGGVTWNVEAADVPNTGVYQWTVPNDPTDSALLAISTVYETDETGPVTDSEQAVSDAFVITTPLAVGPGGPAAFSLRMPNPVSGRLLTTFSLPNSDAATLQVFDIAGRTVVSRAVGGHAGSQSMTLGNLPTGLYVVRLSQSGRSLSNRVAVIQ